MLTDQTLVDYALLQFKQEPEFKEFVAGRLAQLKVGGVKLPESIEDCLSVQVSPGIPLAKLLIEAFADQATQPQWYRLRQAARAG